MCSLFSELHQCLAVALEEVSRCTRFSVIKTTHFIFQSLVAILWKGRHISPLVKLHDIGEATKQRQGFSLMAILEKAVHPPAYRPADSPIGPVI